MPVCEFGPEPGQQLRTEWADVAGGERFGFIGTVRESTPPRRLLHTERMITPADPKGAASAETLNELTLTPIVLTEGEGTLVSYVITYPDASTRETVLATGMVEGMEVGYERLEREVLPHGG